MSNKPANMSETKITSEPDELLKKDKKSSVELTEEELKKVSGGVANEALSHGAGDFVDESEMGAGGAIFWTTTVIAVFILAWVGWSYAASTEQDYPVLPIVPLVIAASIWLFGLACRSILR